MKWIGMCALSLLGFGMAACALPLKPAVDPFYGAVIAEQPGHEAALFAQGQLLMRQGRFGEAEVYFRRMTRRSPQLAQGWLGLGKCALELGQLGRAERAYRRSLERQRSFEGLIGLATVRVLEGELAEARELAASIEAGYGPSTGLDRLLGDIAYMEKDYAGALERYRKSLSENPSQKDLNNRVLDLEEFLTSRR